MSLYNILLQDDNYEIVMGKTTSAWFPQLTHLSLTFELGHALHNGLLGSPLLEKGVELELH
ncbi:hypothetical protein H5410_053506 [Solanum commersonii]|uniref:Uncharacterized protein n=1 Tax=Solanum commersonii TaxID=4109 RepID=A0A9J5X526_SOLCO|nr:hypothetical protein H5410_053506 [Solanum commersonii]